MQDKTDANQALEEKVNKTVAEAKADAEEPATVAQGKTASAEPTASAEALTLYEMLLQTAAADPDKEALRCKGARLSFADLLIEVDQLASAFRGCNVRKGTVMTVCLPNTLQTWICLLALNKIGAVASFLDSKISSDDLAAFLSKTGSECLLITDKNIPLYHDMLVARDPGLVIVCSACDYYFCLRRFLYRRLTRKIVPRIPDDEFYISYARMRRFGKYVDFDNGEADYDWPGAFEDVKEPEAPKPYVRPVEPDETAVILPSRPESGTEYVGMTSTMIVDFAEQERKAPHSKDLPISSADRVKVRMLAELCRGTAFSLIPTMHDREEREQEK